MTTPDSLNKLFRKSFTAFAEQCLIIKHKTTFDLVPFVFNRAQRVLWMKIQEKLKEGKPVRIDLLKARQEGFSTLFLGLMFWFAVIFGKRKCFIVAHKDEAAQELFEKVMTMYHSLPPHIKPQYKRSNRKELSLENPNPHGLDDLGLMSKILVSTCKDKNLGASQSFQVILLSEVARYEGVIDPKQMWGSISQCIQPVPGTILVRETTAQGEGWHKDRWDDPSDGYLKIFFSWIASEEYRHDLDVKDYFTLSTNPESLYGDESAEMENIEKEIKVWYPEWNEDTPENKAAINHEIMCRLSWRRWKIGDLGGDLQTFNQEYPLTPEHAFLASGINVFDNFIVNGMLKDIEARSPQKRSYTFNTGAIRTGFDDWWQNALVENPQGEIVIYKPPVDGKVYFGGVDPCYGIAERNKAAISIFSFPECEEVAVFNGIIEPDYLGDLAYVLGLKYNTALLGVEINGPGKATMLRLWHELYYPNLYYKEIFDTINMDRAPQYGWWTDAQNKAILISTLKKAIKEGTILFNNEETCIQLKQYKEKKPDIFGAPEGKFDDLVSSTMLALQMTRQTHIPIYEDEPKQPPMFSIARYEQMWEEEENMGRPMRRNFGWN